VGDRRRSTGSPPAGHEGNIQDHEGDQGEAVSIERLLIIVVIVILLVWLITVAF
jgi:hypothetical protein